MKTIALILTVLLAGCASIGPVVTDIHRQGSGMVIEKTTFNVNYFTGIISEKSRTTTELK